jgi:hypothetical protein
MRANVLRFFVISVSVITLLATSTLTALATQDTLASTTQPVKSPNIIGKGTLYLPLVAQSNTSTNTSLQLQTPSQAVKLAWFYRPPKDGDLDTVAKNFDNYILIKSDETVRDALKKKGTNGPFLQYLLLDEIRDPGSCTATPWLNQVADQPGDYCRISQEHPDWFMLDSNGKPIMDGTTAYMDPGNQEYREFWLARARKTQEELGWDGLFIDNVEASLDKMHRMGVTPAKYPDDASYQAAIEGFLKYLYTSYFNPQGHSMLANVIEANDRDIQKRYLTYLDGAMMEAFAVGWDNDYISASAWEDQMDFTEKAQAQNKSLILVSQGARDDSKREEFALASYLLISGGKASFRYTYYNDNYDEIWLYDNYQYNLGEPLGPRYQDGSTWRRDFSGGTVTVDPSKHTATISTNS